MVEDYAVNLAKRLDGQACQLLRDLYILVAAQLDKINLNITYIGGCHVGGKVLDLARVRILKLLQRLFGARSKDDFVRLGEEVASDGGAKTLAGAGDDEDFGHGG